MRDVPDLQHYCDIAARSSEQLHGRITNMEDAWTRVASFLFPSVLTEGISERELLCQLIHCLRETTSELRLELWRRAHVKACHEN